MKQFLFLWYLLLASLGSGLSFAAEKTSPSLSDLVPTTTRTLWSQAGVAGGIPAVTQGANVVDFGAIANDDSDDSKAFQQAINSVAGKTNNAVYIPAGTFHLQTGLVIGHSAVLRGAGPTLTTLLSSAASDAIRVSSKVSQSWVKLARSSPRGDLTLAFKNSGKFRGARYIEIRQDNDPDLMYTKPRWDTKWARQAVGQVLPISAIGKKTLILKQPLAIDFSSRHSAQARAFEPVVDVGIENLRINRADAKKNAGYTINWNNAARVWIRNVHSEWAAPNHVKAASVHGCEIRDSYFHHASSYGTGGQGYGINLSKHTTNCLIENNVFHNLRHSMLLQLGANSNVLAYNFSEKSHDHRGKVLPDIALHGHYPYANLFEGNVVNELAYGDFWGPAGPGNVSFRNCITAEGIWLQDESHSQVIVGNELIDTPGNIIYQRDDSVINDIVVGFNSVPADQNGRHTRLFKKPDLTSTPLIPNSLYRADAPVSYSSKTHGNKPSTLKWPSIGSDRTHGCINPASEKPQRNY